MQDVPVVCWNPEPHMSAATAADQTSYFLIALQIRQGGMIMPGSDSFNFNLRRAPSIEIKK